MEVKGRKLEILAAIIEIYTRTSQPVGSSAVCKYLNFSISPATVRNEMAQLSLMGFLEQPYVSAGRIPSQIGYRVYVDFFMKEYELSVYDKSVIDEKLKIKLAEPENLIGGLAKILSEITDCVAVSAVPWDKNACVENIRFVKINSKSAMLILITTTGVVKTKIFTCKFEINEKILEIFAKVIREFINKPLEFLSPESINLVCNRIGTENFVLPVLEALISAAQKSRISEVNVEGELNLFDKNNGKIENIYKIWKFFNKKDELLELLFLKKNATDIFIGNEIGVSALSGVSLIKSYYSVGENFGVIALIGPLNVNYACMVAKLNYISKVMESVLKEFLAR
ncbi:MAG: heat-inducible transcription repressor HrcA [Candidatus Improbicoccus pseudotrichonymphae]|uniref:Heat-inducible transcription repressor HrcA n=1 Tax=Candidatus Improbicoccus pseudotrichonymphae TaxID=3033792 RepID=A0AA48KV55_9FIRM|nr:MAG: heat-inducible transcription repressor HrcA [Candidatus Improbicoccus pseudotrichonymphae]